LYGTPRSSPHHFLGFLCLYAAISSESFLGIVMEDRVALSVDNCPLVLLASINHREFLPSFA
jgi:hypothetical protein